MSGGTVTDSIDLLTALDLLGKAEESRDTLRQTAFASAVKLQERVAELEAESVKLRDVIDKAVIALCNLAEELEPTHREIAERIWTLTNDHLESAALAAVRQEKP
jgi:hypothetical protein